MIMEIETLDIKSDMPPAPLARANLEIEIERLVKTETKLIKVIHGYGSHGVGGEIKKEVNLLLKHLLKKGVIKDYINCEKMSESYIQRKALYDNFPSLVLDSDLKNYNSGITLIFLK